MNDANLGNETKFESVFESFVRSSSSRQIKKTFDTLLEHVGIDGRQVYLHGHHQPKRHSSTRLVYKIIKARTDYWKSNELWKKYEKKAGCEEYANRSQGAERPLSVLIIGSGPVGLRLSIECALLGFKCTVVEKRDRFSRNNVLHLWPYTIHDLKSLGAKLFYGKFCAGSIDHISIRKLQCVLLKVALLMGVQVHFNTSFEQLVEPDSAGWRIKCIPESHVVAGERFDAVIGADGRRNSLPGFRRKEFRGRLAIGITVNFVNYNTLDEQNVDERSGVAFIFDQKFFLDLKRETGIDLENIVYYKDDTHYFVMTAKRQSLLDKHVIKDDYADAAQLLSKENVNFENLCAYAKQAAYHSTSKKLSTLHFAKNHYGQPDVAMFDFTSLFHSENASRIVVRNGHTLLMSLVGDSLLEPFWPLGTGIARGFLAALDTAWQLRGYADGRAPLQLLSERESVYQLLSQTTHDNIAKNYHEFTIDPSTRYCNLNSVKRSGQLSEEQLMLLYDNGSEPIYSPKAGEHSILVLNGGAVNSGKVAHKRARIHNSSTTLLHWAQMVVQPFSLKIDNFNSSWKDGAVLLAIINRYKSDYIDFKQLEQQNDIKQNLHTLFDIIEQKLGFLVEDWAKEDFLNEDKQPSKSSVLTILDKLYECFKNDPILDDRLEIETEAEDPTRILAKRRRPMTILDNESVPDEIKEPVGLRRRGSLVKSAVFQNRIDFFNKNAAQSEIERKASFNRPKAEFEMFESRPVCYKCGLRISKADTVSLFDGIVLHANCFRCQDCNRQLRPICFKHTINQNNKYTFFCNNHAQKDARNNLSDDDNFDNIGQVQSRLRFGEYESPHKLDAAFDTTDYFNDLQRDKFEKRCNFYLSPYQTKRAATSDSSNYSTPNTSFTGAGDDADTTPFKLSERAEFESILETEECNNSKEEEETEEKANLDENIFSDSEDESESEDDNDQRFYSIDTKYITLRNNAQQSITPSTSKSKSQSPYSSSSDLNNKIIENQLNEQVDVYLMRKRAQEKAKLKSDEELGLNSAIVIKRVDRRASSGDEYEDVFNSPPEVKRQSFDFDSAPLAKCETLEDDDDSEPKRALLKADLKLSFGSDSSSSNEEFSSSSLIESFNALNVDNSPRLKRSAINRKRVLNEEKKIVKQNQDRRLRMSQELQRKLDELRHKKDEFSKNVSDLEKRIGALDLHNLCYESVKKTLEAKVLNFIHCKNILMRIENELIIQSQALAIEDRLSECQLKLKETIDLPEEQKSVQIREKEKWLMERLVDFIEEKDRLVDQLEKLKMMETEEDKFVLDILSKEASQDFLSSSNDLFQQFKSFNDII